MSCYLVKYKDYNRWTKNTCGQFMFHEIMKNGYNLYNIHKEIEDVKMIFSLCYPRIYSFIFQKKLTKSYKNCVHLIEWIQHRSQKRLNFLVEISVRILKFKFFGRFLKKNHAWDEWSFFRLGIFGQFFIWNLKISRKPPQFVYFLRKLS